VVLLTFLVVLNAEARVLSFETRLQFTAAMAADGNRPGGSVLSGMTEKERLPAFLGMGSEWGPNWGTYVLPSWAAKLRHGLALLACITILAGFWQLSRAGRLDLFF